MLTYCEQDIQNGIPEDESEACIAQAKEETIILWVGIGIVVTMITFVIVLIISWYAFS